MNKFLTPEQTDEVVEFCRKQGNNFYNKYRKLCQINGLELDDIVNEMYAKFASLDIDKQQKFFQSDYDKRYITTTLWNAVNLVLRQMEYQMQNTDYTDYGSYSDEDMSDSDIESIYYDKAVNKSKYIDYDYEERDVTDSFINTIEKLNDIERKFIICKICLNAPDTLIAQHYRSEFNKYLSELTDEQKQTLKEYTNSHADYSNDIIFKIFFGKARGAADTAGYRAVKHLKNIFKVA